MSKENEYKLALETILQLRVHSRTANLRFKPCLADVFNIAEQALGLKPGKNPVPAGRDTSEAARSIINADDELLKEFVLHDPSIYRDVAAALIWERDCRINEHAAIAAQKS